MLSEKKPSERYRETGVSGLLVFIDELHAFCLSLQGERVSREPTGETIIGPGGRVVSPPEPIDAMRVLASLAACHPGGDVYNGVKQAQFALKSERNRRESHYQEAHAASLETIAHLQRDLAEREATVGELERKLANVTEEFNGEKVAHAAHHSHENEAAARVRRIADLVRAARGNTAAGSGDAAVEDIDAVLAATTVELRCGASATESADLREKLRQAEERVNALVLTDADQREEVAQLEESLTSANETAATLLAQRDEARGAYEMAYSRKVQLAGALDEMTADRDRLRAELDRARRQLDECREAGKLAADKHMALERELATLRAQSSDGQLRAELQTFARGLSSSELETDRASGFVLRTLLAAHPATVSVQADEVCEDCGLVNPGCPCFEDPAHKPATAEIPGVEWDDCDSNFARIIGPAPDGNLSLAVVGEKLELRTRHGKSLTREQLRLALIPLLQRFVDTGRITAALTGGEGS